MSDASLIFLPWVRQGAASAITTVDTLGSKQRAVADVAARAHAQRRASAGDFGAPPRAGGRGRDRHEPGGAHGSPAGHHRLRAQLLSVDRVRSRGLPVAVHAGACQREPRSSGHGCASWWSRSKPA